MVDNPAKRRARLGLRSWLILGVGLGTAAFLASAMGGLYAFYTWADGPLRYAPEQRFPEPRLETNPAANLAAFRAAQRAELQPETTPGGAQLPIERAMALVVRRGAQAYAPLQPPPSTPLPVRPEEVR